MNKKLTLQLQSKNVAELVLSSKSPLSIDVPTNTGGRARALVDTTANWSQKTSYIPAKGEIIVYSDHSVIEGISYPAIKIGDGMAYVVDLPFVGDDIMIQIMDVLIPHIHDTSIHVTSAEKAYWNNKLDSALAGENLILAPTIMNNDLIGE